MNAVVLGWATVTNEETLPVGYTQRHTRNCVTPADIFKNSPHIPHEATAHR